MSAGVAAAGADLSGLFSWWIQELRDARALVAERYGAARSARFQLQLFADHAELSRIGDSTGERRSFKIDGVDLPALDAIWPADKPRNARLDIVLPDADVLVFQLQLPPLSDNELGNAVGLQLERKLPLPRELLYIAWEVTQKLPDRSRIVSVAAARRSKVNEWRERVRAWGWRVTRVCCKDAERVVRCNFLPPRTQHVSFAVGRREALLVCSAAFLAVCYGLLTAGQWIYERTALKAPIQEAQAQMAKVEELRAVLKRESGPLVSLQQIAQAPTASNALIALSTVLPTDTWLYQTEIRALAPAAPAMTLEGYTNSAAALVQAFEQAQQFEGIQLVETSASEVGVTQNRIKLKAQLRASVQP